MKMIDLTGQTFGRLTVIERAENRGRRVAWRCRCECGAETDVTSGSLRSGKSRSCGCLQRERVAKANRTHEVLAYSTAHAHVMRERGKAKYHPCTDCSAPAVEWSYDHTDADELTDPRGRAYSAKPEHYAPRCKACHVAFDRVEVPA